MTHVQMLAECVNESSIASFPVNASYASSLNDAFWMIAMQTCIAMLIDSSGLLGLFILLPHLLDPWDVH